MNIVKSSFTLLAILCTTQVYADDGGLRFQEKIQTQQQSKSKAQPIKAVQASEPLQAEQAKPKKSQKITQRNLNYRQLKSKNQIKANGVRYV
jgi:hypothetical protein